jgi:deoxyribodipyrimidine photolyase-related protein
MEVMQEQQYVVHHVQKILSFFAAMRNFAYQLTRQGHRVAYLKLDDQHNTQTFDGNLHNLIKKLRIDRFEYQLPDEYRLDEQLKNFAQSLTITTTVFDTEHFLTERHHVEEFFAGKKTYLMESFYRHMRQKRAS